MVRKVNKCRRARGVPNVRGTIILSLGSNCIPKCHNMGKKDRRSKACERVVGKSVPGRNDNYSMTKEMVAAR